MTNVPNLRRLLVRNLTYQGATEAVGLTSGLIVTLVLSRHLGVEGFGGFNYLFAFLYFFLTFNDLGINTIVVRESSDTRRAPQDTGAVAWERAHRERMTRFRNWSERWAVNRAADPLR